MLRPPSGPDLVSRLSHAARYRFGRVIEMTIDAIEQAPLAEADGLKVWHYALVWGMQEGPEAERNVFLVGNWKNIETDPIEIERPHRRTARAYGRSLT